MRIELALVLLVLAAISISAVADQRPYLRAQDGVKALRDGCTPKMREDALTRWRHYLEMSDEDTWRLIPGSSVLRAKLVNRRQGCPNCGRKAFEVGGYCPFRFDFWSMPWKVKCPSCGEIFPKNDFQKFYESGLGQDGLFYPERADRSLLFNTEHPDPNDPLHLYGVDDGRGYIDSSKLDEGEGVRSPVEYHFVARYCFQWWRQMTKDVAAMAFDYLRTGEPQLGHKVGIILARMAHVYPGLDYNTQGIHYSRDRLGGEPGKAIRACWEPYEMQARAHAYDDAWAVFGDDAELVEFLTAKVQQCGHAEWTGSVAAIRSHIEQNLVAEGARAIMEDRAKGSRWYGGDMGDVEYTVALLGATVDDEATKRELLEWPFAAPFPQRGGLHEMFTGPVIGREGAGGSSAMGYSSTHYEMGRKLADLYLAVRGPQHRDMYAEYPCIKKSYETQFFLNCTNRYHPQIGDSGSAGQPACRCDVSTALEAFRKFGDVKYAQMAYSLNHHSTEGFSPDVAEKIEAIIKQHGEIERGNTNLNGYGLTILRSGPEAQQRAAWLYYGCGVTNSHTHYDGLNIGLIAYELNLMPDLGYPERTGNWPKRIGWTSNTVSHNTVVVDQSRQQRAVVGNMNLFCCSPTVRLIDVSRAAVYPQTTFYGRSYAMIDISAQNSYLVDIFRVKGGKDHHLSFHSAEGDVVTEGLQLVKQPTGTLAGPDIEFAQSAEDAASVPGNISGFDYLRDVERDTAPPDHWSVEWQVKDTWNVLGQGRHAPTNVRLRFTMLGAHHEVMLADGEPPLLGKPNNPKVLKYLLVHDSGEDVASVYASVIEPYQRHSKLESIRRMPMEPPADDIDGMEAVAIEVKHSAGVTDYILSAHDGSVTRRVAGMEFAGQWGFVRTRDGKTEAAYLVGGTLLAGNDFRLESAVAQYEGIIAEMDREMDDHNCIYTDAQLPEGQMLTGSWLKVTNDGGQDACYEIKDIRSENGRTAIDLGDITFIRSVKDSTNYELGYIYNFEVGDHFTIPTMACFGRDAGTQ